MTKQNSYRHQALFFERLEDRRLLAAHIAGSPVVYPTIQGAVNAALAGAVIHVDAGVYNEQVTISKSMTIRGAKAGIDARSANRDGSNESIVDGISTSYGQSMSFYVKANDVTIDGFTVQGDNNGKNVEQSAGIVCAANIAGVHILNNVIRNNVSGLFISNNSATDAAIIQHDLFQTNNNDGENGGRGIYTDGSLFGSTITNVIIDSNSFISNDGGQGTTLVEAAISFEAQTPGKQSNIRITNNIFTDNGKAVLFLNTNNLLIQGNTVTAQRDTASNLRFEGGDTNVSILNNTVENNAAAGVSIDSKAVPYANSGFTIQFNNFVNNSVAWHDKLSVIANANDYTGPLTATNNWWGSVSGPGGDGKGTGDTIYGNGHYNSGGQWTESSGGNAVFSPWATTVFASPALPPAPTNLTGSIQGSNPGQIVLNWKMAAGPQTSFEIDRSTDGVNFSTYAIVPSTTTTFTDPRITTKSTYYYCVAATDAAGTSAYSSTLKLATFSSNLVALSSFPWVSASAGWGTVQLNQSIVGNPINLRGLAYVSGIGSHAASTIVYNLAGAYAAFTSDVGVDDDAAGMGNVDFQVLGDGKILYDSGVLTASSPIAHINISVSGVKLLTLVATNGIPNSLAGDHADWAGAAVSTTALTPAAPTAPTGLSSMALIGGQVNLAWTNTATNQTAVQILRSADGKTFTTLATVGAGITSYIDTPPAHATYYYIVRAINSAGTSPNSSEVTVTTTAAPNISLSSLTPLSATAGWGAVQYNQSILGNLLTLRGTQYSTGIGTHAPSTLLYNIGGNYAKFASDIGIDDETAGQGAVDFQIYGDGKLLYDSGILTGVSGVVHVSITISGVQQLALVVNPAIAGMIGYAHADWAGAQLIGF